MQEAAPLPAPQPVSLTTWMGVQVPQPPPPTAQHTAAKVPPSVFVPYPEGACHAACHTRQRNRRAITAPPTAMQGLERVELGVSSRFEVAKLRKNPKKRPILTLRP
eukprot:1875438-Amphidinium_carterae.1